MTKPTFKVFLEAMKKQTEQPDAPNDGRTPDADGHPAKDCHGCNYHEAQHNHWRKKKK
jgi:hypothetical protein